MLNVKVIVLLGASIVLAVTAAVFVFAGGGGDDTAQDVLSDPADAVGGQQVSESGGAGGVGEGVGVEGRWVLTVLNEDGSVAERREFHNALLPGGREALAEILEGRWSFIADVDNTALWSIRLFLADGSFSGQCPLGENRIEDSAGNVSCLPSALELYDQATRAERVVDTIVLEIETDAFAGPATVDAVQTQLWNSVIPSVRSMTQTTISPVAVAEGQRVQVSVTLSFATAP